MNSSEKKMEFNLNNIRVKYNENEAGITGTIISMDIVYNTDDIKETKTLTDIHTVYRSNELDPYYIHNASNNRIDVFLWKQLIEAMDTNRNFPKSPMNYKGDIHFIEYSASDSTIKHTAGKSELVLILDVKGRKTISNEIKKLFKTITQLEEFVWSRNDNLTYIKHNKCPLAPQLNGNSISFTTTIDKLNEAHGDKIKELTKEMELQQKNIPESSREDNISITRFDNKSFY